MKCNHRGLVTLGALFVALVFVLPTSIARGQDDAKPGKQEAKAKAETAVAKTEKPEPKTGKTEPKTGETGTKDEEPANDKRELTPEEKVLAGHSFHGDAFNEGPRQKAFLMGGTGDVHFEITTSHPEAQAFFNQAIGQIHGFWDLEAERTFRHVASLDEDCAMAYWGAALATVRNKERSAGFIAEAVKRKDKASEREGKYIDALNKYISNDAKDKKKRAAAYLRDLESIVLDYPDDIEAKALVVHRIWHNGQVGIPVASYVAADALLKDIYRINPNHPAHHYTIHLWDYRKPERAVESAEKCGISAPSIAHMWHMPGHIYSRLKDYEKAVYQQEASARVDHNQMIRDRVMPDEIFNFAHNNEWLIRNLVYVGRVGDALDLAKNMTELPHHPRYNTLDKRGGSASYGRRRLLQVLREFQLYDEAIQLADSSYLKVDMTKYPAEEVKRLRLLACAAAITGHKPIVEKAKADLLVLLDESAKKKSAIEQRIGVLNTALDNSGDKPPLPTSVTESVDMKTAKTDLADKKKELGKAKPLTRQVEKAQLAIKGYLAVAAEDYLTAYDDLKNAGGEDLSWLGELQILGGNKDEGLATLRSQVKRRPSEVIALARLAFNEFQTEEKDAAKKTFETLRDASSSMDLNVAMFARLDAVAKSLGYGDEWLKDKVVTEGTHQRPYLDSLGPFRWAGPMAPTWETTNANGDVFASKDLDGRAKLLIFFLGHGCLHCAEQLDAFGPQVGNFSAAGIDIIAISSDPSGDLSESIANYGSELPFEQLLSDGNLEVFKKFRAFDDFEQQPLHGTFLIDGNGRIRWQDISYQPFMDHEFLLGEAQRLLSQEVPDSVDTRTTHKVDPADGNEKTDVDETPERDGSQ